IRDGHVTGVQTCALPIYGGWELGVVGMARALAAMGAVVIGADIRQYLGSLRRAAHPGAACQMIAADFEALSHQVQKEIGMSEYRSEERRVGKECGSRGSR